MKTVLIFAYFYPPCNEPASQRSGCMAKYLPDYGWQPLVVSRLWTPDNCNYDPDCVRNLPRETLLAQVEDYDRTDGFLGFLNRENYRRALRPTTHPAYWTRNVLRVLPQMLRGRKVDAIWGTFGPTGDLYLARHFSRKLGVPWIADFRDVPGQSGEPETLRHRVMMRRTVTAHRSLVRSASGTTTVSDGLADVLRERHRKDVYVIMNGFDPDDMADTEAPRSPKFNLVYTGCIYERRSPKPILDTLATLIDDGRIEEDDVLVDFYTDDKGPKGLGYQTHLFSILAEYRHPRIVRTHPWVPRGECNEVCRSSTALLLPGEAGKGVVTSKLFAYMAARRPVLAGPLPSGDLSGVLAKTGAGVSCASVQDIADQLLKWYKEWKETGTVKYLGDPGRMMKYSRKEQARQLAELLDAVAARR